MPGKTKKKERRSSRLGKKEFPSHAAGGSGGGSGGDGVADASSFSLLFAAVNFWLCYRCSSSSSPSFFLPVLLLSSFFSVSLTHLVSVQNRITSLGYYP